VAVLAAMRLAIRLAMLVVAEQVGFYTEQHQLLLELHILWWLGLAQPQKLQPHLKVELMAPIRQGLMQPQLVVAQVVLAMMLLNLVLVVQVVAQVILTQI
jgi:hypothetical protein